MRIQTIIGLLVVGSVWGCVSFKSNELYIEPTGDIEAPFHSSDEIYTDYITSEAWITEDKNCVTVEATSEAAFKGSLGLHLKWNRTKSGCPWLGLGFGWDNWTAKDLANIKDKSSLQFFVKSVGTEREVLPWAIGIEDYTGASAWLGMSKNAYVDRNVGNGWSKIELPLSEFNWVEQDCNPSNIKQVIFQFEADGEVFIDEIRLVPYEGGYRKRATFKTIAESGFIVDGEKNDAIWQTVPQYLGKETVRLAIANDKLCIAVEVLDDTPMQNNQTGKEIYNGDCFEILFSTDYKADPKRPYPLSSDHHIGFALGDKIAVWDWTREKALNPKEVAVSKTERGYVFEAKLDLVSLGIPTLVYGHLYSLDFAIDKGNLEEGRTQQLIWNSTDPNFFKYPSQWGEMYIQEIN